MKNLIGVQDEVEHNHKAPASPNLFQVVGSVLASFFGVQSSKNRERDFKTGRAKTFIIVGLLMTGVWYLSIYGVVKLILNVTR